MMPPTKNTELKEEFTEFGHPDYGARAGSNATTAGLNLRSTLEPPPGMPLAPMPADMKRGLHYRGAMMVYGCPPIYMLYQHLYAGICYSSWAIQAPISSRPARYAPLKFCSSERSCSTRKLVQDVTCNSLDPTVADEVCYIHVNKRVLDRFCLDEDALVELEDEIMAGHPEFLRLENTGRQGRYRCSEILSREVAE
ncbi:hypothetical protein FN846DRAFT_168935 [Sphaerosporella brunnea]|uniref:Uncharacterized protein n=1 Tax=Sphaerosporella brunnea TaxID=1250544 RepID=A0A5J5EQS5_9PEZI|nr:hypothetical protein FN846DRAFT_168935 [Sphaerosporella brunnea]